jgi:hypothetical protein
MLARGLLALPSFAIVAICAAIAFLAKIVNAGWATALTMCSLVWAFALYLVAQRTLSERPGLGRILFPIAMILVAAIAALPQVDEARSTEPLYYLPPVSMLFVVVSLGFAVSALRRSEGKSDWPFTLSSALAVFAIAFLPLGIWFLRSRADQLLDADRKGRGKNVRR